MRRLLLSTVVAILICLSVSAWALFMSSGGTPPSQSPGPTITSVTPTTVSIPDTTIQGTTILQYVCYLSDGTTPPCTYALHSGSSLPGSLTLSASGAITTNSSPVLSDCTPAQDNCTWSIDVNVGAGGPQSISQINLSCSPSCGFNVGTASGTTVGNLSVAMNPATPAFTGSLSLVSSGSSCTHTDDTTNFQISRSALVTNGTSQTARTYYVCVMASQTGMPSATQEFAVTGSSVSQAIGATTMSCGTGCTFQASNAGVIGTLSTTMVPGTVGFSGSYQLVASGCTDSGDITHFSVSGATVNTTGPAAGVYHICVQVSQATATNSPQYAEFAITGVTSTPAIVGLIASPQSYLSPPGNVSYQVSPVCLGPCPGPATYALHTNTSGSCTSNDNNSFSMSGNTVTGTGISWNTFTCVQVTMPTASNSPITFPITVKPTAGPTIRSLIVTPAYFSPGSIFSGTIAVSCTLSWNGTPYAGNPVDCTGPVSYALDNTAGDCVHANNTGPAGTSPTFALSGTTLSLTGTQTAIGDYYACVKVSMPGATDTPFQLVATITRGSTDVPVISGIYADPPWYKANSTYSGTLNAYCIGSVSGMTIPCGAAPTFSFQTNCGGQNNSSFTIAGSAITSNGPLTGGGSYPCIAATVPGATGSGVGQYTILYDSSATGTTPTLNGISVVPWYFSTATGSLTAPLTALCLNHVCTGKPTYAFSTSCSSNNNSAFTLSGRMLGIATTTPGTYSACISVTMTGVSNPGASFQVSVTATASTSNCPATPPPQAVDAGFTTLAYCLDPADPTYSSIFNWVNCAPTLLPYTAQQFWSSSGVWGNDCGTSESHSEATRVIDLTTGKWVIDFHWDGLSDANLAVSQGQGDYHIIASPVDWPIGMYAEIRMRLAPDHALQLWNGQCCAPDFWTFTTGQASAYPPGCVKYDPINWCYTGGAEQDIVESTAGFGLLDALHETALPSDVYGHILCCQTGQGYFSADEPHTQEMWSAQGSPDPTLFHSYINFGSRYATDGVATTQYCWYWDEVVPQAFTGSGTPRFAPACQGEDFTGLGSIQYGRLRLRNQFDFWSAGGAAFNSAACKGVSACNNAGDQGKTDQDTYVEYIAIWTCANYNTYNQGNGYDSQAPCPVSRPYPSP